MKENYLLKKSGVVGIIVLFICASFVSSIGGHSEETSQVDIDIEEVCEPKENVLVTCRTFGFPGEPSQEITMPLNDAEYLYDKIKELQIEIARDPLSDKTQQLQHEIITLADEHDLLPAGLSVETLKSRLTPSLSPQHPQRTSLPRLQNRASELFCNYVSTGSGSALPIIILPRLIPILLTPIPRLFVRWKTSEGITSCGGLRSGTGFIALGAQNGIALGFWGIGFSIFLPPFMAYGLFGYALYASVNAENISLWPPNYPPEVTIISPPNGAENVPVSTSELTFQIKDYNEDLMSYTVTTDPDIGSGSGNNKPGGIYSVPISGLEGTEEYTWRLQVSDGEEVVNVSSSFTTEAVAPMVSDPSPGNKAKNVLLDLSHLSFYLDDPQGDLMDYTVETLPDIGSGSGSNVGEGRYTVDVNGLDYSQEYTWFVNVTDGENWKHKMFIFKTRPVPGPWWNSNWPYRKEIIVNYSMVEGELDNFPVLISLDSDTDLATHAQDDCDDIVFTDYAGVKLNHEIEIFDGDDGDLAAWVNVSNLKPDTILYMYYGDLNCSSQQNVQDTWINNFKAVWHMNDYTTSSINDSTSHYINGAKKAANEPIEATGKIGKCQRFSETNDDYIDTTKNIDTFLGGAPAVTVEAWIYLDVTGDSTMRTIFNGNDCIQCDKYYGSVTQHRQKWRTYARSKGSEPKQKFYTGILATVNSWQHHVYIADFSGDHQYFYLDGSLVASRSIDFASSTYISSSPTEPDVIGNKALNYNAPWDGGIDELRVSKIRRSPEWISTEYQNQNDPSSFLGFGPEETGP